MSLVHDERAGTAATAAGNGAAATVPATAALEPAATTAGASAPRRRRWPGARVLRDGYTLYWWVEILAIVTFYLLYSTIRNLHHANADEAYQHARDLIQVQRTIGLDHEQLIQTWALSFRPLVIAANYFYGSLHFVVTGGVMVYLYRRWSNDYPLWRNTLAVGTAIALIGFALFPLMPPRLLPSSYGFVDTLAKDPAIWSFNSGAVSKISNQYAAMPSVHCAWALWCACALYPRVKRRLSKTLAVLYPVATVTAIVVTANHYFLDAPAGFLALLVGYVAARTFTRAGRSAPSQPVDPKPEDPPSLPSVAAAAREPADQEPEHRT